MKTSRKSQIGILRVEHHRNGVGGAPFHVVTFRDPSAAKERGGSGNMVAVLFEGEGRVAVFDRDLLGRGEIGFGVNSWRGDQYEPELRRAVRAAEGEATP